MKEEKTWTNSTVNRTRSSFIVFDYKGAIRGSVEYYNDEELKEFVEYVKGIQLKSRTSGTVGQDLPKP